MATTAKDLQQLLRFLAQDAKVPLAVAMQKTKELQAAHLTSHDSIAKAGVEDIQKIFTDEKLSKQILAAAKRVSKKRSNGSVEVAASPPKRRKTAGDEALFTSPAEIEKSLELPRFDGDEDDLSKHCVYTNRAPFMLAFAVTTLKYTMPGQPLSSRLSLSQAAVSANSRSKAASIGLEKGKTAEQEGWTEGQPMVNVLGREIACIRRWGYDWDESRDEAEKETALWGLDVEALRQSNQSKFKDQRKGLDQMPVHKAESTRSYLLRAFLEPPSSTEPPPPKKKESAAEVNRRRAGNASIVLEAIDLVCQSYKDHVSGPELNRLAWNWYVKTRPEVASGAAGWGSKGEVKMSDILALRRTEAS